MFNLFMLQRHEDSTNRIAKILLLVLDSITLRRLFTL